MKRLINGLLAEARKPKNLFRCLVGVAAAGTAIAVAYYSAKASTRGAYNESKKIAEEEKASAGE